VFDRGAVALVRRPATGRWAGLWGFPILADDAHAPGRHLPPVQHVLTHRRLHVTPVVADARLEPAEATWVPLGELVSGGGPVPIAVLDRKLAMRVAESLTGAEKEGDPA
jgi:A/G-specific adenine glycosylase